MTKKEAIYTIDGKPAKLIEVKRRAQDEMRKEALGDYISARDVHNNIGIRAATLRSWRNSGKVRAKRIRGYWYYSSQDLLRAIKEE